MELSLKGFDSLEFSGEIEMPDIFTMATQPMFLNADFDDACMYAGPIIRNLLNKVPLKGGYTHTKVTSMVQFLSPRGSSIENAHWHLDPGVPAPHKNDIRLHVLCSGYELTSTTKFIEEAITIPIPDELDNGRHRELRTYLTDNAEKFGFKAKAIPPNQICTFTNLHPHIALPPTKFEMRYFLRVQESYVEKSQPWELAVRTATSVLIDSNNEGKTVVSLEQRPDGIFLRTKL